jgi:IS605 OrfB family transposase
MSHRYRAYPSAAVEQVCLRHIGESRWVWNQALRAVKDRAGDESIPYFDLAAARSQLPWLSEGSSSVHQQALRDLRTAFANAKGGSQRFPTWPKSGECESFCVRDVTVHQLNHKWAELTVPKSGKLRFKLSRPLPDDYGMARVSKSNDGNWHVSFSALQAPVCRQPTGAIVGIDRGVTTTLALMDGQMLRAPKMRSRESRRIERLRRQFSRQTLGSKRRKKTKISIAHEHAHVARHRKDWIEKTTTQIVRDYDLVVIEDLKVKNMVAVPAPKLDRGQPANFLRNGARSKAGLNRAIHQQGWSMFAARLGQKASASGVTVTKVNPAYTSQQCRKCDYTAKENSESQAVFLCKSCGHTNHADRNAAENILARGLETLTPTLGHRASRQTPTARGSLDKSSSENFLEGAVA